MEEQVPSTMGPWNPTFRKSRKVGHPGRISWPELVQPRIVFLLDGYLIMGTSDEANSINASTFQKPLKQLAEVLAQKVKREAPGRLPAPGFVCVDLHVLIRQAMYTYDLLFYLNADE